MADLTQALAQLSLAGANLFGPPSGPRLGQIYVGGTPEEDPYARSPPTPDIPGVQVVRLGDELAEHLKAGTAAFGFCALRNRADPTHLGGYYTMPRDAEHTQEVMQRWPSAHEWIWTDSRTEAREFIDWDRHVGTTYDASFGEEDDDPQ